MNDSRSYELKPLDTMNSSGLYMTWTNQRRELKALDAIDSFPIGVSAYSCPLNGPWKWYHLIHVQLVFLDCGPQKGVINKIYNLYQHALG